MSNYPRNIFFIVIVGILVILIFSQFGRNISDDKIVIFNGFKGDENKKEEINPTICEDDDDKRTEEIGPKRIFISYSLF